MLGILLVGFERFEFLHQNLDLVEKLKGSRFTLYVSIDGPKKSLENYGNLLCVMVELLFSLMKLMLLVTVELVVQLCTQQMQTQQYLEHHVMAEITYLIQANHL